VAATAILLVACSAPPAATTPTEAPSAAQTPAQGTALRVAFSSTPDFGDLPALMALDQLADQGYEVTVTNYAEAEFAVDALAGGDADISHGAISTHWAGVALGAPIVTVMEQAANGWHIYATLDVETCAALDGKRFAVSGEGSVSAAMSDIYVQENCPDIERQIVLIQGSGNRAAALLAGEIDATPLELANVVELDQQAPGQFHVLVDFAQELPGLKTTGVHVNRDFATAHPQAVTDYLAALLGVHRQIAADHDLLISEATRRLDAEPDTLPQVVEAHFAINAWDVNGGLTEDAVEYTLRFFTDSGELEAGLEPSEVADLTFLNDVLDDLGSP
jgi:NitT/TauT family transport system substrate-binding protein